MEENPLPATHGRACYHPCENACNRSTSTNRWQSIRSIASLAILRLKRVGRFLRALRPESASILASLVLVVNRTTYALIIAERSAINPNQE
jgi:hypothetical protein